MTENMKTLALEISTNLPWRKDKKWYKKDSTLQDIIETEKQGLFEPPKLYYLLKKDFLVPLFKESNGWGVLIIRGPRRIGKTSTLKYIIKNLLEKENISAESIFYFSLDDEKLLDVLNKKRALKEFIMEVVALHEKHKPLLIVLDEVTFYKGWARALKNLIDEGIITHKVGIIATGSYSMELSSARSELAGRYGPLGDKLGGEVFFHPRRFIEVAENILGEKFRRRISKLWGKIGSRLGTLEYLSGFQDDSYSYEKRINDLISLYLDDLRGALEIYKYTGGYPKALFEAINSHIEGKMHISDARYRDDIYKLIISDSRKFRLNEEILNKILLKITKPIIMLSEDYSYFLQDINLKKEDLIKHLNYLKSSSLLATIPAINNPEEANIMDKIVLPSSNNLKLLVTDPAAFIAFNMCSRGILHDIFSHAKRLINETIEDYLIESIVISHLRNLPFNVNFSNTAYILKEKEEESKELTDAFLWYLNHKGKFITIAIEVKNQEKVNEREIQKTAEELKEYNVKRLIVVSKGSELKVSDDYIVIPIEVFLSLF